MRQTILASFIFAFSFIATSSLADDHGHARPDAHLAWTRDNTHARIYWDAKPSIAQDASFKMHLMNGTLHKPTKIDASVNVELWLPTHNHGSSPVMIERIADDDGTLVNDVYRVSKLFFTMEGEWEVRVTLNYADGSSEMQKFTVSLP